MKTSVTFAALSMLAVSASVLAAGTRGTAPVHSPDARLANAVSAPDPRIRSVLCSADKVITVQVSRGIATQIVLCEDEVVTTQPAMGKGSDCNQPTDTWCVVASGRDVFIKPKTGATTNNMLLVTSRRRYAFEFRVLNDPSASRATMRLSLVLPPAPVIATTVAQPSPRQIDLGPPPLTAKELVASRMRLQPTVRNKEYSVAVGDNSEDIVPAMVFDDGTKTYFSFPNNRPLPTIFETTQDQSEAMVNAHMEGDQLVADHVARRFVLRLGNSVAAIINEAFDIDGVAPVKGTTVPGVERVMRPSPTVATAPAALVASQGGAR